ncbi:serine/threonine protein kinase [Candidatus Uabimicrobium sp. HlEnr_7]|uniref:serine/threonine protein kinase n=1 Tax=Candidatus Uabimicrobium helgolandensis TaxID=3095367 RepID=UPI00355776AF
MTPELMIFVCEHCQKEIKVTKDQNPLGKQLVCSGCNNVITLNENILKKPSKLITFICPSCKYNALVQENANLFGKQMVCGGCTNPFILSEANLEQNQKSDNLLTEKDTEGIPIEFSGYKLLSLLGKGGMGKVFKAFDSSRNENVAMKVMMSDLQEDNKNSQRFLREAKATTSIDNPNIVKIYDVGVIDDMYYFTMEIIEGNTFDKVINENLLSLQMQTYILIKVIYALGIAHSQGIVHRDLKPSNIIVNNDGEPKVMDFGLAKFTEDVNALTKSGDVLGTIDYMSPEQAGGRIHDIDHRTDLYALGVILYEVLTKKIPFKAKVPVMQLLNISKKPPVPPHEINNTVPLGLSQVCVKALAKSNEDRYQHAGEFIDAIQPYLSSLPAT